MAPAGDGWGHADRVPWEQEKADLGLPRGPQARAVSGDDSSDGKAQAKARECDEMEGLIRLAGRRRSPGWDLIALGQVPALCC